MQGIVFWMLRNKSNKRIALFLNEVAGPLRPQPLHKLSRRQLNVRETPALHHVKLQLSLFWNSREESVNNTSVKFYYDSQNSYTTNEVLNVGNFHKRL